MRSKSWQYPWMAAILAAALTAQGAFAGPPSPFVGQWQGLDVDGSEIRLTIGGPAEGPFQITWTEDYISFCDGGAGIMRGTGSLNETDPYLLEADLWVECFTAGAEKGIQLTFRYFAGTNVLSTTYYNGMKAVFRHPRQPKLAPAPLGLRVNYGHDWVEGFYESGHTVWLAVTESDGVTVKATAEVITEPKDFWDGGTGFQTNPEDWDPEPPDIEPYDWVYAWLDNGASAQAEIGEINGAIDLVADSIAGTVSAGWFAEELYINCDPWGLDDPSEYRESSVYPDGDDKFECSWAEVLDIRPGQEIGVWYYGPDGHAVANAFSTPHTRFTVFPEWNYLEGYEWPDGAAVSITVTDKEACSTSATAGYPEWDPWNTFFSVHLPEDCSLEDGDQVTLSTDGFSRTHEVQMLTVTQVNMETDTVSGTADFDPEQYTLHTWIHEVDGSEQELELTDDSWTADFSAFGLEAGMCGRVEVRDQDGDATAADWCVPNTRFTVFPEWNYLEGYEWPDGAVVSISVAAKEACSTSATAGYPEWDPWNTFFSVHLPEDCSLEDGNVVTLSTDGLSRTHEVQMLAVTQVNMETDTVSGTADFDPEQYTLHTWIHEVDDSYMELTLEDGTWEADFSRVGLTLEFGMGGRVEVVDQGSNATAVDWNTPPAMGLRVNYGHDWVESFYEAGHKVSLTVTEADGETVKAIATVFTEDWGWQSGFQTADSDWEPAPPDMQPLDWVFATVDNGVSAEVKLGTIEGEVDISSDSVAGTIKAAWIGQAVPVECLDWGSGLEEPINKDAGYIMPNGAEEYGCSWDPETEWDVDAWQEIGVGYSTPDGHWVANAFHAEHWVGLYTHDLPLYWSQGDYTYYLAHSYSVPFEGEGASKPLTMTISGTLPDGSDTPTYPGNVLLQYWAQRAWTGDTCEPVDVIHPDQPTRFVWGWMTDFSMPWEEALAHFNSLSVTAYWEGESAGSQDLTRISLVRSDEFEGACYLTEAP